MASTAVYPQQKAHDTIHNLLGFSILMCTTRYELYVPIREDTNIRITLYRQYQCFDRYRGILTNTAPDFDYYRGVPVGTLLA
ncbi:hypothetical protein BHE74_00033486 [Ensete ventricosum]|nr:hypothetical protein GW17_00049714 [Ensete ventricosum]RWW59570.1 hypothetical protein BHE74_00033486 [Ensete ventricosum]RZS02194.1 hypothetical protein BHM03_00032186 [Ensete ventricosum]